MSEDEAMVYAAYRVVNMSDDAHVFDLGRKSAFHWVRRAAGRVIYERGLKWPRVAPVGLGD